MCIVHFIGLVQKQIGLTKLFFYWLDKYQTIYLSGIAYPSRAPGLNPRFIGSFGSSLLVFWFVWFIFVGFLVRLVHLCWFFGLFGSSLLVFWFVWFIFVRFLFCAVLCFFLLFCLCSSCVLFVFVMCFVCVRHVFCVPNLAHVFGLLFRFSLTFISIDFDFSCTNVCSSSFFSK